MFIWPYFELILTILLPLIAITQIIIPAIKGTPIFPFFRRVFMEKRKVEDKIGVLKVAKEVKTLNKTADKLERELNLPDDLEKLKRHAAKATKKKKE